jgi:hypothetical protein
MTPFNNEEPNFLVEKEKLSAKIKSAFADVTLGDGIGLFEADAFDMCVDFSKPREARQKDERESWQKISVADLGWCNTALSFTDAEGYRFLVPAFMLAELNTDEGVMTLIHLSLTRSEPNQKKTRLSVAQIRTIIEFLELYQNDPHSDFHHEAITEALGVYWLPLLEQIKAEQ